MLLVEREEGIASNVARCAGTDWRLVNQPRMQEVQVVQKNLWCHYALQLRELKPISNMQGSIQDAYVFCCSPLQLICNADASTPDVMTLERGIIDSEPVC
jgi:hypothetical protein